MEHSISATLPNISPISTKRTMENSVESFSAFSELYRDNLGAIALKCTSFQNNVRWLSSFSGKHFRSGMNNSYEVFDGAVDRGEVLTALDTSWLRVTDVRRYRYLLLR